MTPQELDDLWTLMRRRWPTARHLADPGVVEEWSTSLLRLEHEDAMAGVIQLSESDSPPPAKPGAILAAALEARAQRLRERPESVHHDEVDLTALWTAEARAYQSRYGMSAEWLAEQMAVIRSGEAAARAAFEAHRRGPEEAKAFIREARERFARRELFQAEAAVPVGGKDRAADPEAAHAFA
jgi:hypothetical protein